MARIALDADVVIAFLDPGVDQHNRAVKELRPRLSVGDELLLCATVYAETIVRPLQRGTARIVDEFLDAAGVRIVPVDRDIARRAAQLRGENPSLRLPDALSLATAVAAGATLLTLDRRLQRIAQRAHAASANSLILHITTRSAWERARAAGAYRPASLDNEGFIHFSGRDQLVRVANARFSGATDLVLLCVIAGRLTAPLTYEAGEPDSEEEFPHLYGPLNLDAVVEVVPFPEHESGFELPGNLPEQ